MIGALDDLHTLRDWLRWSVSRFAEAGLCFGHGTDNAWDEAVWLLTGALHVPRDRLDVLLDARLTRDECHQLMALLERRIMQRVPVAYLLHEAWLGPYRFFVDERVIVPRSFFAELLEDGFAPWIADPSLVVSALDLCTGSGCLAIVMAQTFENADIDAIDISPNALAVAARNVADYDLAERIELIESDLFAAVPARQYDLIISNPPYVTLEAMRALPPEYRHEPPLALAAGEDGLDVVRRLLAAAPRHLAPGGVLAVEVGHNRDLVDAAFPELPLIWLDTENFASGVFVIQRDDLIG